ncbi:hypothetical protein NKH48_13740 [Mesorhizobium sp. M1233]|uniref:hypothetical protein n=1 Tax=Mesorhizobium sp. M1233 TaxID=2957072 RepID=UPI003336E30F
MAAISDVDAASLLARVSELFLFDEEAGYFVFRVRRGGRCAGSVAGSVNKAHGYREIMIDYRSYRAHEAYNAEAAHHHGEFANVAGVQP